MQAIERPHVMAGVALAGASLIAVTPIAPPPDVAHTVTAAVRLTSTDGVLGDFAGLLGGGDPGGLFADGSLLNIPYNLFADVVNIPYEESLGLQEFAYALGPAGVAGGVPGWIPPGVEGFGTDALYPLGGTGSWYMESLGNTWGWDDGNWPQVAAISNFLLPFSFTNPISGDLLESFAQSEFIDGAHIDCEFECANPLGYLSGWLHGDTSLASLLSPGTSFPTSLEDTVGGTGITNLYYLFNTLISSNSNNPAVPMPAVDTIWSGQPGAQINLLEPLQAIAGNLTASPSADPIQFPDLGSVFSNALTLSQDISNDFNPFVEGSFLWWGAAADYSIPSAIGGTITDFTGIPNQFGLANYGAEPLSGYTSSPLSLPGNFLQGLEYLLFGDGGTLPNGAPLGDGLLGYLNPDIYLQALNTDIGTLTNPENLLAALPLVGYLGLGGNPDAYAPGSLLGTFYPGQLSGPFDSSLLGSLNLDSFNPGALAGGALDPTALTANLSALLPGAGADLASMLGTNFGADLANLLGTNLGTDLSQILGTSAATMIPDLALQLLTAF